MRHRKAGRKLSRNASHRVAMMRNMAVSLIQHERIITTVEKAKTLRPFVEKLVTMAKKNTLHARRLVIAKLGPTAKIDVDPEGEDVKTALSKLFNEIAPRFATRPGGYTRILKRSERRLGDGGRTAFIEFLAAGETKPAKQRPVAPVAPRPANVTPPAPAPAPAPAPEPAAPPPAVGDNPPPA